MSNSTNLLKYKKNIFSQYGEDGIIAELFQSLKINNGTFCEFGAWDGIHLSNCRNLALQGWSGVMIEALPERWTNLCENYSALAKVHCINAMVDSNINTVSKIVGDCGFKHLDFLSIDIDGLDYEIFLNLDIKPLVICVEVNAGHPPESQERIPLEIASNNVGQPLQLFCDVASRNGYVLVCYNSNAFFVQREKASEANLTELDPVEAYRAYLAHLPLEEREFLYLVNKGAVFPNYKYNNPYISGKALSIPLLTRWILLLQWSHPFLRRVLYKLRGR